MLLSIMQLVLLASEWKSFLFFYIPVMNGILPDQYYVHAFLLVKSLRLLLSCSISEADMQLTETLLHKFCSGMETLYGKLILMK